MAASRSSVIFSTAVSRSSTAASRSCSAVLRASLVWCRFAASQTALVVVAVVIIGDVACVPHEKAFGVCLHQQTALAFFTHASVVGALHEMHHRVRVDVHDVEPVFFRRGVTV